MSFQWKNTREFLDNFDLREFAATNYEAEKYGDYIKIPCPFHSERTASCVVYRNAYHCFGGGCGAKGNSIAFLEKTLGLSFEEIINSENLSNYQRDNIVTKPERVYIKMDSAQINRFNNNLLNDEDKIAYLYKRHFDRQSVQKSCIGYTGNTHVFANFDAPRYSIPVYNERHDLITARYRIDPKDDREEPKYLGHPKTPAFLYNSHICSFRQDIVVVGSEFDAAFLYYRYNIAAVAPPGEGSFKEEWAHLFKGCNVLIWYDYDYAGIMAAIKSYNILRYFCNKTKIYQWGSEFANKDDTCDFVAKYSIDKFIDELDRYDIKANY